MGVMTADEPTVDAAGALADGRWADARAAFERMLASRGSAEACFGLAMALWLLGENHACVERCSHAYVLFRESGEVESAARCTVWLAVIHKTNFAKPCCARWPSCLPDRVTALREMARVAPPGGTVAVLVPSSVDAQPAYGPFVDMAARHAGPEARSLLSTYFACGDDLTGLFEHAGLPATTTGTHLGTARFPSVDAAVTTEVDSTPLGERITTEVYDRSRDGAREVLAPSTPADGSLEAPFEVHVVTARRP